jgi:hypothetical protein
MSTYTRIRRPQLVRLGLSDEAIEYLMDLEQGEAQAIVSSLAELSLTPSWPGRKAKTARGLGLIHTGTHWILDEPENARAQGRFLG